MVVLVAPSGQVVHWRSEEAVPSALTKLPGAQVVHGVHFAALAVALKLSASHAKHLRSVVALPFAATDWPATQSTHATHAVAGSLSWSHVPFPQTCFGVSPPAQWVPASQAVHTGGDVDLPAAVCSVPAAHSPSGTHAAWFTEDEYVPSTHGEHS